MRELSHHKVTELPLNLEPNAIYFVRNGDGYDEYITSDVGTLITATPQNKTEVSLHRGTSPTATISQSKITSDFEDLEVQLDQLDTRINNIVISADGFTEEDRAKLEGIAELATKNSSDVQLRDRATHTGTQDVSTITGLGDGATKNVGTTSNTIMAGDDSRVVNAVSSTYVDAKLLDKVDKVVGKELSTNDFTDLEKQKLASIESSHFRGTFVSYAELESSVAAPLAGDYADVDGGIGEDVARHIWDTSDGKWVFQQSSTTLTSTQLKYMYESNPDTNAFTDDQMTKLTGVEELATKNLPDSQLIDRAYHTGTQSVTTITGLGDGATKNVGTTANTIMAGDDQRVANVSGGSTSGITNPDTITYNAITYSTGITGTGMQHDNGAIYAQFYDTSLGHQMYGDYRTGSLVVRGKDGSSFTTWRKVWDSGNQLALGTTATTARTALTLGTTNDVLFNSVTATGNVTSLSDERIKENVIRIPNALEKVQQIGGYTFNRTDIIGGMKQVGVLAQEIQKVLPEVVTVGADGVMSVAYGNIVGLLIEAIKELREEVQQIKEAQNGTTK